MKIKVLDGVTTNNGVPTAGSATVGFALKGLGGYVATVSSSMGQSPPLSGQCAFKLKSTAGSGTMTLEVICWVFSLADSEWAPLGADVTASKRGMLNGGNAITEVNANSLVHTEYINGLQHYDRVYFQTANIGGTATAVDGWLIG